MSVLVLFVHTQVLRLILPLPLMLLVHTPTTSIEFRSCSLTVNIA
jgi:hypothetical protein